MTPDRRPAFLLSLEEGMPQPLFVGRRVELLEVEKTINLLRERGRHGVELFFSGFPGIGKSTFLEVFRRRMEEGGIPTALWREEKPVLVDEGGLLFVPDADRVFPGGVEGEEAAMLAERVREGGGIVVWETRERDPSCRVSWWRRMWGTEYSLPPMGEEDTIMLVNALNPQLEDQHGRRIYGLTGGWPPAVKELAVRGEEFLGRSGEVAEMTLGLLVGCGIFSNFGISPEASGEELSQIGMRMRRLPTEDQYALMCLLGFSGRPFNNNDLKDFLSSIYGTRGAEELLFRILEKMRHLVEWKVHEGYEVVEPFRSILINTNLVSRLLPFLMAERE